MDLYQIALVVSAFALVFAAVFIKPPIQTGAEKPNQVWIPTAAEVVGYQTSPSNAKQSFALVRFTPPGKQGFSELPAFPPVKEGLFPVGHRLLVLLDPLSPVTPYLMDVYNGAVRLNKIMRTALFGAAFILLLIVSFSLAFGG
jgi:hypothetical protein